MKILHDIFKYRTTLLALMLLAVVSSCGIDITPDDGGAGDRQNNLQLAFAIPSHGSTAATKSIDDITQTGSQNYFHGMQGVTLIPFRVTRTIASSDAKNGAIPQLDALPSDSHVATNYAYVYSNFPFVPIGTSSFLLYGYAPGVTSASSDETSAAFKLQNGSLIASGLGSQTPSGISFSPEQIWTSTDEFPAEAATIIGLLNQVVNTAFTKEGLRDKNTVTNYMHDATYSASWREIVSSSSSRLASIFNHFVNYVDSQYKVFGISGSLAAAVLSDLYHSLNSYNPDSESDKDEQLASGNLIYFNSDGVTPFTRKNIYEGIKTALLTTLSAAVTGLGTDTPQLADASLRSFPTNHGLPEGAVGARWNSGSNAFEAVAQGTKSAIAKYCYPPRLWYYDNTRIKTSTVSDNVDQYNLPLYKYDNWSSILNEYNNGTTVAQETQAIALVDPVQYAVAMLSVRLKKTSASLPDAGGDVSEPVTVGTDKFPLTALFVAGQRQQTFDFTPLSSADDFVTYDKYPNQTIYLNSDADTNPVNTLVLQTLPNEDIYIALEFQNDSGRSFVGQDGVVVPGGKFYLIGMLEFSKGAGSTGHTFSSVFEKDYQTNISVSVNTLAHARNVIPNLSTPQLDLGVQITIDWKQSTSTNVPMY